MAKITQVITRPSQEYDYTVAEAQTRDLDGIVITCVIFAIIFYHQVVHLI